MAIPGPNPGSNCYARRPPDAAHARRLGAMRIHEIPVDLDAESGPLVQVHEAVADFGPLPEQSEPYRIPVRRAVRFNAVAAARKGRDEVRMQFGRMMRREPNAVLLGDLRDSQRFGESGVTGGIELHVADRATLDEIAHREAREFALAVCERYRNGVGEQHE